MTDNISEEYRLVKLLIEEMQKKETKAESSISTITTMFAILFGLQLLHKAWRYIGKPVYRRYSSSSSRTNSDSDGINEERKYEGRI